MLGCFKSYGGPMKKVLILDDQKELLDLWHWHFKLWGEKVEVYTGTNGAEGIALAKDNNFDLIITDFTMPQVDGLNFITQFRLMNKTTPIFLFSGEHPEICMKLSLMENVRYFEKPVIGGKLRMAITILLNGNSVPIEAI